VTLSSHEEFAVAETKEVTAWIDDFPYGVQQKWWKQDALGAWGLASGAEGTPIIFLHAPSSTPPRVDLKLPHALRREIVRIDRITPGENATSKIEFTWRFKGAPPWLDTGGDYPSVAVLKHRGESWEVDEFTDATFFPYRLMGRAITGTKSERF
jgi:hypothetical protein